MVVGRANGLIAWEVSLWCRHKYPEWHGIRRCTQSCGAAKSESCSTRACVLQVLFIEDDQGVETLAPQGADNSLRPGIRARGPNRSELACSTRSTHRVRGQKAVSPSPRSPLTSLAILTVDVAAPRADDGPPGQALTVHPAHRPASFLTRLRVPPASGIRDRQAVGTLGASGCSRSRRGRGELGSSTTLNTDPGGAVRSAAAMAEARSATCTGEKKAVPSPGTTARPAFRWAIRSSWAVPGPTNVPPRRMHQPSRSGGTERTRDSMVMTGAQLTALAGDVSSGVLSSSHRSLPSG